MAKDLRSSNVQDLEVRGAADGTELIPCEVNGRDVYLTAAQIAALSPSSSGLPEPWTADQIHGNVVATVDDPTLTPVTIQGANGQAADLLVLESFAGTVLLAVDPTSGNVTFLSELDIGANVQCGAGFGPGMSSSASYMSFGSVIQFGSQAELDSVDIYQNDGTRGATGLLQALAGAGPGSVVDPPFTAWSSWASNNASRASFKVEDDGTIAVMSDTGSANPPIVVYAPGSDTTVIARIMPTGAVISNAHAAPADGDLNNSDFALWLDDTPGATKLKIKAKDSAGTVRTATVALA